MPVVLATVLERRTLAAADARPGHVARRNVTLSPRHGTRVVVRARRTAPLPAASLEGVHPERTRDPAR